MSQSKDINVGGRLDKLPIKLFTFDMFVDYPAIIMIAKRGSGKSWVVRAILNHFREIPVGLVISPTDKMSCFYGSFFPESYIFYNYNSEIIERVLARQEAIIEKNNVKMRMGKRIDTRAVVVMDDCLSQKGSWVKDQPIQELLYNGRHYHIMYILTMQYPLGITPELRSNFDYIFLLAEDFQSNIKRMYDHYAGMFPTFNDFRQVFSKLTSDFGSMVIVNRGARSNLFEKIYSYKAPNLNDNKNVIGCKQFRDFHKRNYDVNWRSKGKKMSAEDYFANKKKNKASVNIAVEKAEDSNVVSFGKKNKKN